MYTLVALAVGLATLLLGGGPTLLLDRDQDTGREPVLVRATAEELRSANSVRPLMHEEQSVSIDRVRGVYPVTLASFFEENMRLPLVGLLYKVTSQGDMDRYRSAVEVHKTDDGRVLIVEYVDRGTAARLTDAGGPVGGLFLYHKPQHEDQIAVAIPASRIVDWDHRVPHEFSEIEVE